MGNINKVTYRNNAYQLAKNIADNYNLELLEDSLANNNILIVSEDKISLKVDDYSKEFFIDFLNDSLLFRTSNISQEAILKACGVRQDNKPSILDLTGGWGIDGYILARAGCEVLLLERDPIVHLLLEDGIRRLREKIDCKISAKNINAIQYLAENDINHEVIYLDPIRPQDNKRVKNKKEIEILRKIIQEDQTYDDLLSTALHKIRERLVIKSGRYDSLNIVGNSPNFTIFGRNTKFDIFK